MFSVQNKEHNQSPEFLTSSFLLPIPHFTLIPVIIIHQMKVHGLLCFHGFPIPDGLKYPAVGFKCLFILCLLDSASKDTDAVCNYRHQIGHDQIVGTICNLGMKLRILV